MDARIARWAETLVGYCLEVQPGHLVVINATPAAEPLVRAVTTQVLRAGGHPLAQIALPSVHETLLREGNDEQVTWLSPVRRLLAERADARLNIASETNTRQLAGIHPRRMRTAAQPERELRAIRNRREPAGSERWCLTLFPTQAYAQDADMSLADFEEFVYEACFLNSTDPAARWRELGARQQVAIDWLRGKREVRVISADTDLRLSIAGRGFRNSDGKRNFPSGEFFTSPVEDSVEGHIRFTIPSVVNGHAVQDIRLTFERGRVVEATAAQGQEYLDEMLAMDEGARGVGEFAIGNNPGIQHGIRNVLFDEKIGGTVHLALGNSYPETGGTNVSGLHWDMVCDLRPAAGGGEVAVDDTLFLKDGRLVVSV